ncbi:putative lipase serine esterase protein [Neofusicoccum parvum UCRNP2]|uniref:Putative lipase serine esterase protein n=1 Tax=Botryosphaeria parva (strain UCR-NP2) TaxID=1287680 RepID=R1GV84_BOTPV|nr:putative lipase serine esterase protein [Neofusicoccum parvum UCRNP2]
MFPFALSSIDTSIVRAYKAMGDSSPTSSAANHLCVLVHGLWGNPNHLAYLSSALREAYSEDQLHILVAARNSGSFTYDGVELGGERIAHEIEEELERLARNGQTIRRLSIIGYSLGGLVSRYAVGLLYHKGWFEKIEPVNFTTFATPHLGVRTPLLGVWNHLWNVLGARTLSMSGRQLFMIDSFRDTGRPLLGILADPDSVFIKGLAKFKHRSLYCNVVNDRTVVYYTAGISRIDPFVDPQAVKINYLKGYDDVIIDPDNPVSPKDEEDALPTFYTRLAGKSYTVLGRTPMVLFLMLFVPIATVLFLLNSGVQSIRSSRRIRLHAEGKSGIDAAAYSIPLLMNNVRREAEEMFEGINHNQEYLPSGSEELASSASSKPSAPKPTRTKPDSGEKPLVEESGLAEDEQPQQPDNRQLEFPTLALTPAQFAIIQTLEDVGIKKFPVYIHKHRHSHAAIIVRMQKPSFDEGKVVVKHWLDEFEV